MHTKLQTESLTGKHHFGDLSPDRIILKCILKEQGVRVWTAFIWVRIWTSGGLL
jgi:hypothetical protein